MADVALGQVWEVYSERENGWVRAVIAKHEDGRITFRYEGTLELFTVSAEGLDDPKRFRIVTD